MSKQEEKKEAEPKEDVKTEEVELSQEEKINQLEIKCKALETLSNQYRSSIPYLPEIGRPIQLNVFQNGLIYQLTLPDVTLSKIEQFKDLHSVISKFSAITSKMEENATQEMQKKETEKEEKAKVE